MSDVWRCSVCHKVKELKGPHLNGKTSVRSDCWPCAKKTIFLLSTAQGTQSAAPSLLNVAKQQQSGSTAAFGAAPLSFTAGANPFLRPTSAPAGSAASTEKANAPPADFKSKSSPFCSRTVLAHVAPSAFQGATLVPATGAAPAPAPTVSPYVMQRAKDTSPPFTFKAVAADPEVLQMPAATSPMAAANVAGSEAALANEQVWVCASCGKIKELKGSHLNGKTTVRSDCWPCAKKQCFALTSKSELTRGGGRPSARASSTAASASPPFANTTPVSAGAAVGAASSTSAGTVTTVGKACAFERFAHPFIPSGDPVTGSFLLPESPWVAPPSTEAVFTKQLLCAYRARLMQRHPLRTTAFDNVLYVLAPEPPAESIMSHASSASAENMASAYALMGQYAATFLAVEQLLSQSRFSACKDKRVFCFSEFIFAAACAYVKHSAEEGCGGTMWKAVHGPQVDPTRALSIWGGVIAECSIAESSVVSEDQRGQAAQTLYHRTGWVLHMAHMTGCAIQLAKSSTLDTEMANIVHVVLLPGIMPLGELAGAALKLSLPWGVNCG